MLACEGQFGDQLQALIDQLNSGGGMQARSALDPHTMMRNEWDDSLRAAVAEDFGEAIAEGGARGISCLAEKYPGLGFDVTNPEVTTFLQDYPMTFARKVNARTANNLAAEFVEGLNNGETVRELSDRVRDTLGPETSRYRADMIARTESSRAQHAGQNLAWKQSGVVSAEVWSAAPDCCDFCQVMDGKVAGLDEAFLAVGGSVDLEDGRSLVNNYETVGYPPLHPHCRCDVLPVMLEPE